jgi:ADP-ribose pyrophosphatase
MGNSYLAKWLSRQNLPKKVKSLELYPAEPFPMQPWKTLSRQTILNHSKWLVVEDHTVQLPDGRVIPNWCWVIMPNYVNVAAMTEDGQYICFRQTKYSIPDTSLATVGGYLDPGEDPLSAAQRELREETGCIAPEWISLGAYAVHGNHGSETAHFYLARGAHKVSAPVSDDLEEQELLLLSRQEVETALRAGEFKVLAWAAIMSLALMTAH